MEMLGKQSKDLAAVMRELSLSLDSAENTRNKAECDNSFQPPSYEAVHDAVVKQPVDTGDLIDKDSTEKKFTDRDATEKKFPDRDATEKKFPDRDATEKKFPDRDATEKKFPDRDATEKKFPDRDTTVKKFPDRDTTVKKFPDRDTTEKKFPDISSDSEDSWSEGSESDTEIKTRYPIQDKTDLLKQIENLKKEQESLRRNQQIHEQHIKDLLEREPCVHKRFKTLRKSYSSDKYTEMFSELKNVSLLFPSSTNQQHNSKLTDEHIYVQLEQLYANFHVLHFPSKTAQNILNVHQNNYSDAYSSSEITSLRNKVRELEQEILTMSTNKTLSLPTSEGNMPNQRSPTPSRRLRGIPGRPTSPLPIPPVPRDLCPVEVTFKWTIANYSEKLRQEQSNEGQKEISSPFYLTHCGYRAQVELYLNGNGTGASKCMSVFLRVIKGEYDQHLKWPVNLHLVVILVNQSGDHNDSLKALGNQFQYSKPSGSMDGESDCWGLIEFASHEMTKQRRYICDDRIVIKWRVQIL